MSSHPSSHEMCDSSQDLPSDTDICSSWSTPLSTFHDLSESLEPLRHIRSRHVPATPLPHLPPPTVNEEVYTTSASSSSFFNIAEAFVSSLFHPAPASSQQFHQHEDYRCETPSSFTQTPCLITIQDFTAALETPLNHHSADNNKRFNMSSDSTPCPTPSILLTNPSLLASTADWWTAASSSKTAPGHKTDNQSNHFFLPNSTSPPQPPPSKTFQPATESSLFYPKVTAVTAASGPPAGSILFQRHSATQNGKSVIERQSKPFDDVSSQHNKYRLVPLDLPDYSTKRTNKDQLSNNSVVTHPQYDNSIHTSELDTNHGANRTTSLPPHSVEIPSHEASSHVISPFVHNDTLSSQHDGDGKSLQERFETTISHLDFNHFLPLTDVGPVIEAFPDDSQTHHDQHQPLPATAQRDRAGPSELIQDDSQAGPISDDQFSHVSVYQSSDHHFHQPEKQRPAVPMPQAASKLALNKDILSGKSFLVRMTDWLLEKGGFAYSNEQEDQFKQNRHAVSPDTLPTDQVVSHGLLHDVNPQFVSSQAHPTIIQRAVRALGWTNSRESAHSASSASSASVASSFSPSSAHLIKNLTPLTDNPPADNPPAAIAREMTPSVPSPPIPGHDIIDHLNKAHTVISTNDLQQNGANPFQFLGWRSAVAAATKEGQIESIFNPASQIINGDSVSLSHAPYHDHTQHSLSKTPPDSNFHDFAVTTKTQNADQTITAEHRERYQQHFEHPDHPLSGRDWSNGSSRQTPRVVHKYTSELEVKQNISESDPDAIASAQLSSAEVAKSMHNLIAQGSQQIVNVMDKAVELTAPTTHHAESEPPRSLRQSAEKLVKSYENEIRNHEMLPDAVKGALLSAPEYVAPLEQSAKAYKTLRRHALRTGKELVSNAVDYITDELKGSDSHD